MLAVELSKEHQALDQLASRLLELVSEPGSRATELASVRWRLHHLLMVHLAKEDRVLYPQLMTSGDPLIRSRATRFSRDMGGLATTYLDYAKKWTAERVFEDRAGFVAETRSVMLALRQRIVREERDLYPLLADSERAGVAA